jgi:FtsP/CotA-like multicopper oxidase with cupredoxin domain
MPPRDSAEPTVIDRRTFLAATAAAVASPLSVPAGAAGWRLRVGERAITVKGRTATVYGLTGLDGRPGLVLDAGVELDVLLRNDLAEPTMIHWHGLAPPWSAAGVPDAPEAMIEPGGERAWRFPVGPGGTHLVHAHTLQAQNLLAAPLIVRTAGDRAAGAQEVVVLLQDFSFTPAGELLAGLIASTAAVRAGPDVDGGVAAVDHAAMAGLDHAGLDPATAPDPGAATTVVAPADEAAVLSVDPADVAYDALLANDRTLSDPEVHTVERGAEVRLRIVNAAASTAFTVDLGTLEGSLVAVDGRPVLPVPGRLFPLAMGQRIDVRLRLPDAVAAWPVIARAEGSRQRTGVVLVTAGAAIPSLTDDDETIGPPLDTTFEARLVAAEPLPDGPVDRRIEVDLAGMATGFAWAIQGAEGLVARRGERVELAIVNRTLTAQPMHLHGHRFQVTGLDALRFPGAVRDTVLVPPGATAVVAFDADNPGRWPFHNHHLYRMAAGMTTTLVYEDTD